MDRESAEDRGENDAADESTVQVLHDFFEHEGDRGERSIECRRQARRRACSRWPLPPLLRDPKEGAELRSHSTSNVN